MPPPFGSAGARCPVSPHRQSPPWWRWPLPGPSVSRPRHSHSAGSPRQSPGTHSVLSLRDRDAHSAHLFGDSLGKPAFDLGKRIRTVVESFWRRRKRDAERLGLNHIRGIMDATVESRSSRRCYTGIIWVTTPSALDELRRQTGS